MAVSFHRNREKPKLTNEIIVLWLKEKKKIKSIFCQMLDEIPKGMPGIQKV